MRRNNEEKLAILSISAFNKDYYHEVKLTEFYKTLRKKLGGS